MNTQRRSALYKSVLLPGEHGSWAFVLEPVLLGTLLSGSLHGLWVVLGALFGFLAYRPLKLGLRDVFARKYYPRTRVGLVFGSLLLVISSVLFCLGWPIGSIVYVYAVGVFCVMGLAFALLDARLSTGALGREIFGAVMTIPLATAAYWTGEIDRSFLVPILALCLLCLAKSVPTVLYVRARLRPIEERGGATTVAISAAIMGLFSVAVMEVGTGSIPVLSLAYCVLAGRIIWGLSKGAHELEPKWVGMQEFAYSIVFLALVALLK